jgi:hypothetical protein
MYATKHCLPISWTKKLMCMTPQQEEDHKKGQIEMYNMSNFHKLIQVNGDHWRTNGFYGSYGIRKWIN